jgi:hypothetical protein
MATDGDNAGNGDTNAADAAGSSPWHVVSIPLQLLQVPAVQEALSTAPPPVVLPEVAVPQGPPQALLQPLTAMDQEQEGGGMHTPLQRLAHVAARVRKVRVFLLGWDVARGCSWRSASSAHT